MLIKEKKRGSDFRFCKTDRPLVQVTGVPPLAPPNDEVKEKKNSRLTQTGKL